MLRSGLMELRDAYPAMLSRLRETLLAELQVPNASASLLEELRARAENVRQLSGESPAGGFRRPALSFLWKQAGHGEPGKHGD